MSSFLEHSCVDTLILHGQGYCRCFAGAFAVPQENLYRFWLAPSTRRTMESNTPTVSCPSQATSACLTIGQVALTIYCNLLNLSPRSSAFSLSPTLPLRLSYPDLLVRTWSDFPLAFLKPPPEQRMAVGSTSLSLAFSGLL